MNAALEMSQTKVSEDNLKKYFDQKPSIVNSSPSVAAIDTINKILVDTKKHTYTIPVDVAKVAERFGILVQEIQLSDADGALTKEENEPFKASLKLFQSEHRKRFTLAHEIGHFVKDYQNYGWQDKMGELVHRSQLSSLGKDPDEIWANTYAATLLMPASALKTVYNKFCNVMDSEDVEGYLADVFNVSPESMHYRLLSVELDNE